ncbi:hypothetical protein [Moorena sp. SIO4E2]|uniref:hypothetical protein n=1 Tax=Moorena sp. SIO4E2 TaxID=2607826 RepID=UPI00257BB49D|nr:hypothetical protein [Moorena sp. SIO4E2]
MSIYIGYYSVRSKTKQNRQTLSLCSRLPTPDSRLPTPDSLAVKTSLATKQSFHKFITRERP